MSSESYRQVVGGRLRLKGHPAVTAAAAEQKKKKKKKRKKKRKSVGGEEDEEVEVGLHRKKARGERKEEEEEEEDTRTPAERKFDELQRLREEALIAEKASRSYRERIDDMNKKLSNLSEHHDIPRVTPGPR